MPLEDAIARGLLRDVRECRDDRQQDVAEMLAVSRETISRWENGHEEPRPSSLRLLEMAYLLQHPTPTHSQA
jgi:transcriptional regulator with XRE-family HTH domain